MPVQKNKGKGKGKRRPKIKVSKKCEKNQLFSILQAFDAMEQGEGPPKANPERCEAIAEYVRECCNQHNSDVKLEQPKVEFYPPTRYRGIKIPKKESWDLALSYYETIQDEYIDKDTLTSEDMCNLTELELWFVQIIEPPPTLAEKFDAWENRELSKVVPGISPYCAKKIRTKFGLGLGTKLPSKWGINHKSTIETLKRISIKINVKRPGERTILPVSNVRPRTRLGHLTSSGPAGSSGSSGDSCIAASSSSSGLSKVSSRSRELSSSDSSKAPLPPRRSPSNSPVKEEPHNSPDKVTRVPSRGPLPPRRRGK